MQTRQAVRTDGKWSSPLSSNGQRESTDLALVFGARALLKDPVITEEIQEAFPFAKVVGCSTAGEIQGTQVFDDTVCVTSVAFEHTTLSSASFEAMGEFCSREAGIELVSSLPTDGLRHVLVISNGLLVNGSELVKGITEALPEGISVTGGLSADGADFEQTVVMSDGTVSSTRVAAIGFYGDRLRVGHGSLGGWDSFGPRRRVTRAEGNILYELDGRPGLDLYRKYLGDAADGLPATGLLFPLSIEIPGAEGELVRTILAINEDAGTMTFAGDVPEGATARLMRANFDRLIDGASGAARSAVQSPADEPPDLAILISCVGRKLVLKQRVEEEVEAVHEALGGDPVMTGFYSYGEISPVVHAARCELHNQTMTVTTFTET